MKMKERIVEKAIELYNERGIEYVGMRELAAELGLKLGNITYYFPRKEDLIYHISGELAAGNVQILQAEVKGDITAYFAMVRKIFDHQHRYRCLLQSFVHLVRHYEMLGKDYAERQLRRRRRTWDITEQLVRQQDLRTLETREHEFLTNAQMLLFRFWLSEAAISYGHSPAEQQKAHYLQLLADLLRPYCTESGRRKLNEILP